MEQNVKYFIELDVNKDSIAIAAASANSREEALFIGTTTCSVSQIVKALPRSECAPSEFAIVYEAGPCLYGLQQELLAKGYRCAHLNLNQLGRRNTPSYCLFFSIKNQVMSSFIYGGMRW